jgi:hypothetical protein
MHASCSPCICSGQCQKLPRISQKPHSELPSSPSPPLRLNTTSCQTMKLQHDRNKHALRLGYIPRQVCCHSCACHNQACGTHTMPQPAHNSTRNGSAQSHTRPCHNSTQRLVQAAQPICIADCKCSKDSIRRCGRALLLPIAPQDAHVSLRLQTRPAPWGAPSLPS